MYSYIILSVLAAIASNAKATCPEVKPVKNFDLNAYGTGVWYEVGRYPNVAEKEGNCGAANYKLNGDVIDVNNTHVANNKLRFISGSAKLADDAGDTGKLVFTFPYGAAGAKTDAVLSIIATDYTNYAVAYYCKYIEKRDIRIDFAWVLSRSKKLDGEARTAVEKILKDSPIIDSGRLIWPDFSEEACKVEA